MPVQLLKISDLPAAGAYEYFISTCRVRHPEPRGLPLPDLPQRLETAFEDSINEWWQLGKELGTEPTGDLCHAAVCTPNASEMGLMLAWTRIVDECAGKPEQTLVICDDPWLFRHLASRPGITAGSPPPLVWPHVKLAVRGAMARAWRACRLAAAAIRLAPSRGRYLAGAPALLVYGHPESAPSGRDAYFGNLMSELPHLQRVFHVDAPVAYVEAYKADPRSFSLHAWGSPWEALKLWRTIWRPTPAQRTGKYGWLVRREQAVEGATAQGVMVRWQQICQAAWLAAAQPTAVSWPWENHAWERAFVRAAKKRKVCTFGYQHTVVGRHAANHAPASNPDGLNNLPDQILCNGDAGRNQLLKWNIPQNRLVMAGSFRFTAPANIDYDPNGPIFVALPMKHAPALEMIDAVRQAGEHGVIFLLKVHPMTNIEFEESSHVRRTNVPLQGHKGLRGVLYAASTVGLEALLAELPTLRFLPRSTIAIDILSPPAEAMPVSAGAIYGELETLNRPQPISFQHFFADADPSVWRDRMSEDVRS